jgi:HWE histidine kinase
MLTAELSHRVKNLFAVVQVLAERSASKATSAAECIEAFRGRLQALNAAHNALIAANWNWASLLSLVETALEPYLGDGDRIRMEVQDLRLNPDFAVTLASGSTSWPPTPSSTARLPVRPAGSRSRRVSRRASAATSYVLFGRRMADRWWTSRHKLASAPPC